MGYFRVSHIISVFVVLLAILYGWRRLSQYRGQANYTIQVKHFGTTVRSTTNTEDFSIKSFKIPFEQSQVDDVINRLSNTRFYEPQMLVDNKDVNQSTYGFTRQTAEIIREYWINKYDWKKTVEELNTFDHYKTNIAGLDIHFVRVTHKSETNNTKQAILFLHGWPSSFIEYLDAARLLNSSTSSSYDLIIPSLPGFGYSEAPKRPGMDTLQMAHIMHVLMQRLGYNSYVVCGSDWGSFIGTYIAQLYPKHVRGLLSTMVVHTVSLLNYIQLLLGHFVSLSFILDPDEQEFLMHSFHAFATFRFLWYEGGFFHLQATRPDTIGFALNDSPIGLAAYILEKWSRWSNKETEVDQSPNSGLDRFTFDQVLSNVMLYWTTGTITSSMRINFEHMSAVLSGYDYKLLDGPVAESVPVAIVNHRREKVYTPRMIAKKKFPNIKLWLYNNEGGHFAAIEKPQQYTHDIEKFLLEL